MEDPGIVPISQEPDLVEPVKPIQVEVSLEEEIEQIHEGIIDEEVEIYMPDQELIDEYNEEEEGEIECEEEEVKPIESLEKDDPEPIKEFEENIEPGSNMIELNEETLEEVDLEDELTRGILAILIEEITKEREESESSKELKEEPTEMLKEEESLCEEPQELMISEESSTVDCFLWLLWISTLSPRILEPDISNEDKTFVERYPQEGTSTAIVNLMS